ncbi:protein tramtrack, beta isoform-like isoform X6 [Maniola jurtina]|uniref:protein tramtrack, beta isoform-like isoform X6 n=1 Tax=Maniola jurtina TaxID=191418 RepID=UPI001E6883C0|nr:protein tramtrack, beta isoform-like isoform X6 [Maniola jurtina]
MASDEQFSLCWNNFHANMSAGFHGLLSRGDLVDVTLAAEGRLLQAHKLVLSVCSPYFQEMFKMNPTHHPIVFLKDVSHSALRDLLQFMYQGEVNVKQEELASFISTAEQLQVKGLTGNQNEESSTPSKPKPTSRPGPRSSQQRQSVMTKLETDLDSKPSSTPVAIKRPNRPSIASNNSSSSQSGPVKRKCVDPLEAGPSGSAKEEFVTIPDEDENNAVAPKMEPEFVNESMWDEDDDGTNNDETNFGEDDSNMEMSGFDGSTTGDGNITGGGEGGAVGDAQEGEYILPIEVICSCQSECKDSNASESGTSSEHMSSRKIILKKSQALKNTRPKSTRTVLRDKGEAYVNTSGILREARRMRVNPCKEGKCQRGCYKISEERRKSFFQYFWNLDRQGKKEWIINNCKSVPIKRRRAKGNSKRDCNYEYFITDNEGTVQVCLQFLQNTLDVSPKYLCENIKKAEGKTTTVTKHEQSIRVAAFGCM